MGVYTKDIKCQLKILIFLQGERVYKNFVPNQRAPGQKLMPIPVDEQFLRELDAGLTRAGYRNRSQFVRDAILEKLKRAGISLPTDLALPPQRTGKGILAKIHYPEHKPSGNELNERARRKRR
jgi:Arc/MetJ-type ribon-helix-helix transcriptional regulator